MRFNTSSSGTAKMKFTNRMNLVVQQAIKPYRAYVISLLTLLMAITGVMGYLRWLGRAAIVREEEIELIKKWLVKDVVSSKVEKVDIAPYESKLK